jgi:regulatory protein
LVRTPHAAAVLLGEGLWHKNGVSPPFKARRPPPPLNDAALSELGLRYVGKYATTRSKLRAYLARKLRERGWDGTLDPDLEALADRFAELGYVDDAAFALTKSRSLAGRGYGKRRLAEQLKHAGITEEDSREALDAAETAAVSAALRFAQRRRIGPFAAEMADPQARERAIAAMVRAGHDSGLARKIMGLQPDQDADLVNLCESLRLDTT